MSGNKKKAKRRTAKALQNLRKTPEKATPIVAETIKPIRCSHGIDEYDDQVTVYKSDFTEYGKRLIEHYVKVYSGIDDPDFVFENEEDEDGEDEYDNNDDGSWPKHCPHCGAPRRSTTIVKNPNPNAIDDQFDELDGDFNEDEADEN